MTDIKAIIFDCFGVLTTESWLEFKQLYFGADSDKMQRATEINKLLNTRLLSYEQGAAELAELAGIRVAEIHSMFRDVSLNKPLFHYIEHELKPKYKIGLLSNVSGSWVYTKFSEQQLNLFDAMVLSSDLGYTKPHRIAYEAIADRLGLLLEECLFIDDQERNTIGAQEVGMQAICYTDLEQLTAAIHSLAKA